MVRIDIKQIEAFLKKHDFVSWKPIHFPEDMTEESTFSDLESEGNDMFYTLDEAKAIMSKMLLCIKYMKEKIEDAKGLGDADSMDWFLEEALKPFKK